MSLIYKICDVDLWEKARAEGHFIGAEIDLRDGFIHFSTTEQLDETLRLHFEGVENLLLLTIDGRRLDLKWEPARTGDLFPHLYDILPLSAVLRIHPLLLDDDGRHILPSQL
jgi:uncharacterized protein (DUF952 family)